MTFAVDASVVTKLYFAEDRTDLARALFADAQQGGELVGCELWVDDERMLTAIGNRLPFVRRLADYRPQPPTKRSDRY